MDSNFNLPLVRCMEEFFKQGDKEQEQGLEFSPLCDRQNTMVPQSQIGFIDFIVAPTLAVCGDMVAAVLGEEVEVPRPWTDTLATNRSQWQEKVIIVKPFPFFNKSKKIFVEIILWQSLPSLSNTMCAQQQNIIKSHHDSKA